MDGDKLQKNPYHRDKRQSTEVDEDFNSLNVVQQKTEENQTSPDLMPPTAVLSDVNNRDFHNKLLEMDKQEDVLSVMDNQSVFGDPNNVGGMVPNKGPGYPSVSNLNLKNIANQSANGAAYPYDSHTVTGPAHQTSTSQIFGILSAVCYQNGRAHFVFSDRTSLILHPKGDCFTYFRSNGRKLRQLVKYALNQSGRECDKESVTMLSGRGDQTIRSNMSSQPQEAAGPLEKLCLAVQLYNTYNDVPLLNREEFYSNSPHVNIIQKTMKITHVTWPGQHNLKDYAWQDEQGNFNIKSVDEGICHIVLSANFLHFRVQYLHLLDQKKEQWVGMDDRSQMIANRQNLSTIMGDRTDQPFVDNLSSGNSMIKSQRTYNGPPSTFSNMRFGMGNQQQRQMRMVYQYVQIEQIHSMSQCPARWAYPLKLLSNLTNVNIVDDLVILADQQMLYPDKMVNEIITGKEYKVPLPSEPETKIEDTPEHSPSVIVNPSETILSQEMTKSRFGSDYDNLGSILQSQKGGMYANSAAQKFLHDISIQAGQTVEEMLQSNSQLQELLMSDKGNINQVWTNDEIAPASHLYSYKESNIKYLWNPDSMTRLLSTRFAPETLQTLREGGNYLEVHMHQDNSFFYVKEGGNFITHMLQNLNSVQILRSFTCNTIPFSVRYANMDQTIMEGTPNKMSMSTFDQTDSYNPQMILKHAFHVLQQPYDSKRELIQIPSSLTDIQNADTMAAQGQNDQIVNQQEMKDLGTFTAYSNKAIKVVFNDRTIVRAMLACPIVKILNRKGDELLLNYEHPNQSLINEYQEYLRVSQEYLGWAFLSDEERQQQEHHKQMEASAIDGEIERIQRTVKLIGDENTLQHTIPHYQQDLNQVTFEANALNNQFQSIGQSIQQYDTRDNLLQETQKTNQMNNSVSGTQCVDPEMKAEKEIFSNNQQIDDIQKLLDSLK